MLCGAGSFGVRWVRTFGGRSVRKTSHASMKIRNQGAGLSWGINIARGGWGPPIFSLKG